MIPKVLSGGCSTSESAERGSGRDRQRRGGRLVFFQERRARARPPIHITIILILIFFFILFLIILIFIIIGFFGFSKKPFGFLEKTWLFAKCVDFPFSNIYFTIKKCAICVKLCHTVPRFLNVVARSKSRNRPCFLCKKARFSCQNSERTEQFLLNIL